MKKKAQSSRQSKIGSLSLKVLNTKLCTLYSRFQQQQQHNNYYSGKLSTPTASFTRPTPVSALNNQGQAQHHPLPTSESPHITPLNPSHGQFSMPAPPSVGNSLRGLSSNKPNEMSNQASRIQQAPTSIGMHPTFRSDFNVSLRYFFFCIFLWFPNFLLRSHSYPMC